MMNPIQRHVVGASVFVMGLAMSALLLSGCSRGDEAPTQTASTQPAGPVAGALLLDWKPEPEFGGFYAAQLNNEFAKQNLKIEIQSGGEGADTWQMVATDRTLFATTAADQVLIARAQKADVVAFFAVYQTFPQGIMVHESRHFKSLADLLDSQGVLLTEPDTWLTFLNNKYPNAKVSMASWKGGIAEFLSSPKYSQQCFVTSEPILAKRQGGDPQTFLIADEGYNPYTTVVICSGKTWRLHPEWVKAMTAACRAGWGAYLADPNPTNAVMQKLNTNMDARTFTEAAAAQIPLIQTDQTRANGLGTMTAARWADLGRQLVQLRVLDHEIDTSKAFVNP